MPELVRYTVTQTRQVRIVTAEGIEKAVSLANQAFSSPGDAKAIDPGISSYPKIMSTTIERDS